MSNDATLNLYLDGFFTNAYYLISEYSHGVEVFGENVN